MKKLRESLWGALQIALHVVLGPVLHRRRTRWGATEEEIARKLPGDELVPHPVWGYDHAITIDAPRSCGRGSSSSDRAAEASTPTKVSRTSRVAAFKT